MDPINFQDHPLFLKKKAEEARKGGDLDLAADYSRALYRREPTEENLRYFFRLLLESGAKEEAYDLYASHGKDLNTPKEKPHILDLLLEVGAFDEAREQVTTWAEQVEDLDLDRWEEEISRREEAHRAEAREDQEDLYHKLYSLSAYPVWDQVQILQDSQILDENKRFQALSQILTLPTLTQEVRGLALDLLSQMGRSDSLPFLHGEERLEVDLSQLVPMAETETFRDLHQALEAYSKNPSLQALIQMALFQDFPKIYPLHEKIEDPKVWLDFYAQFFEGGTLPEAKGQGVLFLQLRQAESKE